MANIGDTITYTIVVGNNGPNAETNAVVVDTLPTCVDFVSADNGGVYDAAAGTITWNFATVPVSASAYTLTIVTTASAANTNCLNSVTASGDLSASSVTTTDGDGNNNGGIGQNITGGGTATNTPTGTSTATPTATITPTITPTVEVTSTPTATLTSTSTPTITSTPSITPTTPTNICDPNCILEEPRLWINGDWLSKANTNTDLDFQISTQDLTTNSWTEISNNWPVTVDWGDGNINTYPNGIVSNGTGYEFASGMIHTYSGIGVYIVTITITGADGTVYTREGFIEIIDTNPPVNVSVYSNRPNVLVFGERSACPSGWEYRILTNGLDSSGFVNTDNWVIIPSIGVHTFTETAIVTSNDGSTYTLTTTVELNVQCQS